MSALPADAKNRLLGYLAVLSMFVQERAAEAPTRSGDGVVARAHNAGMVISVVVIGVVSLVGMLIFGQVYEATPETGTELDTVSEDILTGFGDAMGLVPIILLVLLAAVVINVVNRMR